MKYYDGTKLLSMLDADGNKPEIYMCTSNRSAGKTTYFNRFVVNRFKKRGEKFCLLYRYQYELDNVADKFFKDIHGLFFQDDELTYEKRSKGLFCDLYLNEEHCGYAITINGADNIKKLSHLFSDVSWILFDEFQSETNHYCPNEISKFISIHISLARGNHSQSRYLPVIMLSNTVTILNPYFTALRICDRLRDDTKFLRGSGFVLEQCYNDNASRAQRLSGFNKAFSDEKDVAYASEAIYLQDSTAFIESPKSRSKYVCTLKYSGREFAIREYTDIGILYCGDRPDLTYPVKICVTTDDHEVNYVMIKRYDMMINTMRYLFEKGCFRFKNLRCKEAVIKTLSY